MRMLGIDPGLGATGWGLVSMEGLRLCHHNHGIIRSTAREADTHRLAAIADQLEKIISEEKPEAAIIEEIFVVNNPRSALRLGMARGVAVMVCGRAKLPLYEISARRVKQAVTGTGKADKKQVSQMVARLLNIKAPPSDAGDALAMAIAGLQGNSTKLASAEHTATPSTGLEQAIAAALARQGTHS
jgi:crossover junction endodeoxyribonuclease RuvC